MFIHALEGNYDIKLTGRGEGGGRDQKRETEGKEAKYLFKTFLKISPVKPRISRPDFLTFLSLFYSLGRFRDVSPRYFFPWSGRYTRGQGPCTCARFRSIGFLFPVREERPKGGEKKGGIESRTKKARRVHAPAGLRMYVRCRERHSEVGHYRCTGWVESKSIYRAAFFAPTVK